ncbi:hypothetical protein PJ985_08125 [Streptomyces sp. ACA25]|uniref:hypothetical protein n=1 Tax=Streptomyces sp. ACA25 TaxID=3022596 RepID=UPI002307E026|nr:hypothetical protein [Streptomyces sp. ACA25]MDB1087531.1 hypothetical protein [Streptomyces sp. ACA25]
MRHHHTAASAALALILLTACSSAGSTDDGAAEDGAGSGAEVTTSAGLTDGLVMPLDTYRISDEDQQILEQAREALVAACMRELGQEYTPARHPEPAGLAPYTYLYGVDDPVLAAEHGYMHPIDLDPNTYAPVHEQDLTEEQELALYGDPDLDPVDTPLTLEEAEAMAGPELDGKPVPITGCAGDATLRINNPDADWVDPTVLFQLEDDAGSHADEDERVAGYLAEWSECMAGHGYETDSPLTVQEDLGLTGDVSGEAAIEAALKDIACKEETDLVARWAAVDAEHQEEEIEEHAEMLSLFTEQHAERMAAARDLLD